jgi:fructose-bisphosphate aldolase, class I
MNLDVLAATAQEMVSDYRGLLAADESTGTIKKRFDGINVESTENMRRDYREMLFRAEGLGKYISGTILFDETLRQSAKDGTRLADVLKSQNIIPGIKVDTGAKPLAGADGETVTEGLDGLTERVAEYVELGARFAKWRAVITIGDNQPTDYAIRVNAQGLARYARICQEGGLVPIVEPEVLMDGSHDINACQAATERTLNAVFEELFQQGVALEGMILKPNMVISGSTCAQQADAETVARMTVETLRRCVPAAVPGVMFLSGGQSEEEATVNLNAMNQKFGPNPWALSYSYGRALQAGALKAWVGKAENEGAAQDVLLERSRANSAACAGKAA